MVEFNADVAIATFTDRYNEPDNRKQREHPFDNSRLHAGSPMYIYCKACGAFIDSYPEGYLGNFPRHCQPCRAIVEHGLLAAATKLAQEAMTTTTEKEIT